MAWLRNGSLRPRGLGGDFTGSMRLVPRPGEVTVDGKLAFVDFISSGQVNVQRRKESLGARNSDRVRMPASRATRLR
jgi:hypothetical protein